MVILTQYHTEIQNRGISTIGAAEIFPVSRMPRFQRLHCINTVLLDELLSRFMPSSSHTHYNRGGPGGHPGSCPGFPGTA